MSFPDWGNVPAWLGAGSLLLAYRIFLRDRANTDRAQVDRIGVWGTTAHERKLPWDKNRVETGEVKLFVRNATDLPVDVRQVAYIIHTRWTVPDLDQCTNKAEPDIWSIEPGAKSEQYFVEKIRVAPQETWDQPFPVNFAHLAPDGASQPEMFHGVTCEISWVLLTDNAGRRWELRPTKGDRARRIRRYNPQPYQPREW